MIQIRDENVNASTVAKAKVYVIIPAAGQGSRMGAGINKVLLKLDGQLIIQRTLSIFQNISEVSAIQIVGRAEERASLGAACVEWGISKALPPVIGGATRQDSVYEGLMALSEVIADQGAIVLVHDAARCLVTEEIIRRCVKHVEEVGPCVAAVPVKDTIKRVTERGVIQETLPREALRQVQTPQAFHFKELWLAYQKAKTRGLVATDDASIVEAQGQKVSVVEGAYQNIKLTTSEDLLIAEAYLRSRVSV